MSENKAGSSFFRNLGVERRCRGSMTTKQILNHRIMYLKWPPSSVDSLLSMLLCLLIATTPCLGQQFQQNITVLDQLPAGSVIGQIGTGIPNANPPFSVYMANENDRNDLDILTNGTIRLKTKADRSRKSSYEFLAISGDTIQIQVSISILPLANRPPVFNPSFINLAILETVPVESTFFLGSASDPDFGPSGIAGYEITSGNTNSVFRLNVSQAPNGAKIVSLGLTKKLDYKAAARYLITVRAYDTGSPALYADLLVNITIVNVYDNQPVFSVSSFSALVREDALIGTTVVSTVATHQGSSASGRITYSIDQQLSQRGYSDFTINAVTGLISVAQRLSFTRQSSYELVVIAEDDTVVRLQATAVVQIQVVSVSIQPPVITLIFFSDDGSAKVTKSANQENDSIAYVSVTYPGQTDGLNINVTLLGGDGYFGLRRVGNVVFLVVVSRSLENAEPFYQMSVFAVDSILSSRFAYKNFTLYIVDGNSSGLVFSQNPYYSTVDSTALPGTSVAKVLLVDRSIVNGSTLCFYRIMPLEDSGYERFYIDRYSGAIVTAFTFDCRAASSYRLTVAAVDPTCSTVLAMTKVLVTIRFVFNAGPYFNQTFYRIMMLQSLPIGSCVGQVSVSNYPGCSSLTTDRIQYTLSTDARSSLPFVLDQDSGMLCLKDELDASATPYYDLPITATNEAGFSSTCLIQLNLIPINRVRPTFTISLYRTVIPDNLLPGSNVVLIKASANNQRITYQIISGNFGTVFNVSSSDSGGYIQLKRTIPSYPTRYNLTVVAVDEAGLMSATYANVTVDVIKSSLTALMFTKSVYEMRIPEDAPRGQLVGKVDMQNSARVRYSVIVSESSSWFQLDASAGQILTIGQLDREYLSSVLLNIQAQSTDGINTISFAQLALEVREDIDTGSLLYIAQATDKDSGDNALIYYSITGDVSSTFIIDRRLGEIRLQKPVRFPSKFSLTVIAYDGGSPSRSASLNITIATVSVNNNSPVFSSQSYRFTVSDRLAANSVVGVASAVDADPGRSSNVSYYLSEVALTDLFLVDPFSGKIYNRVILDYSQQNQFIFQVVAVDSGFPVRSSSAVVTVTVQDDSANTPLVSRTVYDFSIAENQPPLTTVGFLDSGAVSSPNYLTFSLQSPNEYFGVIPSSGEILTDKILDREEVSVHKFNIVVVDHGSIPRSATVSVTVTVLDVNDNSPQFDQHAGNLVYVAENQPPGSRVVQMIASDPDNGSNGTVSYYFPSDNSHYYGQHFEIDLETGWISSKEQFDQQSIPEFWLKVVAEDGAHPPRRTSAILRVAVGDGEQNELQLPPTYNLAFTVQDNAAVGTNVTSLALATNSFGGEYYIMKGNAFNSFGMDATTGNLYIALPLRFDDWSVYSLSMVILESDPMNPVCVVALVNITVIKISVRSPQFEFDPQSLRIRENIPRETVICRIDAGDFDSGNNEQTIYSLVSQYPPGVDWFQVDGQTGLMKVNSDIDYEKVRQITVVVMAMVQRGEVTGKPTTMTMVVDVTDINDNRPEFDEALLRGVHILEDVSEGAVIAGVCATDADSGDAGRVAYEILSGNENGHFYLDPDSGLLSVVRTLNRQRSSSAFQLNVSAADRGRPSLASTFLLTIAVVDVNKNTPLFDLPWYNATVFENTTPGAVIVSVHAADRTTDTTVENKNLTYGIPFGLSSRFSVNSATGDLVTNTSFDRELTNAYTLAVFVKTSGFPALYNTVAVQVKVLDSNDNAPVFSVPTIVLDVPENEGPVVLHVFRASDDDTGVNGLIFYYITGGNTDSRFSLHKTTGVLSCTPLDQEAIPLYNLTIMAVDGGTPSLNSTMTVVVRVLDDNDNDPVFLQTSYTASISEKTPVGTTVLGIQAIDLDDDVNGNVSYGLSNDALGMFSIDLYTGALVTVRELDTERVSMYSFEVTATDGCPYRPRSRTVRVNITILGVNRNSTVIASSSLRFCSDRYVAYVWENNARLTYVTQVRAVISVRNGSLIDSTTYWIASGNAQNAFIMDPPNSGIVKTNGILDREIRDSYRMDVQTSYPDQLTSDGSVASLRVQVIDVNDNAPFFPVNRPVSVREGVKPGTLVLQVTANDVDLYPVLVYQLSSVGGIGCSSQSAFTIDRYSGKIWTDQRLDYESCASYQLTIQVSDRLHNASTQIQINIIDDNDNTPLFSQAIYQTSVPEATVAGLSIISVTAMDRDSGDNGYVTYSLLSPTTDNGFRINSTTGTIYTNRRVIYDPNQTTLYFVVMATDRGTPPLSSVATVVLKITEANKKPIFNATTYSLSMSGTMAPGSMLLQLSATDPDFDYDNSRLEYSICGGNGSIFGIGQDSGEIFLLSYLEPVDTVHYLLKVMVQDRGTPALNSSATVLIIALQVNDKKPELVNNEIFVSMPENTSTGSVLATLQASSFAQMRLLFNISSGNEDDTFSVNAVSGAVSLKSPLNFEQKRFHRLVINTIDTNATVPRLLAFSTINVNVTEVNKHRPRFPVAYYSAAVTENLRSGAYVCTIEAVDDDSGFYGILRYRLVGNSAVAGGLFSIDELSGEVSTSKTLTFSSSAANNYSYVITADDTGGWSTSASLTIYVKPEPVQPHFSKPSYSFQTLGNAKVGDVVGSVEAFDGNGQLIRNMIYFLRPENKYFAINNTAGTIYVQSDLHAGRRRRSLSRHRRSLENVTLHVFAQSGFLQRKEDSVDVIITVDQSCDGCAISSPHQSTGLRGTPLILVIVFVVFGVLLAIVLTISAVMCRRKSKPKPTTMLPMDPITQPELPPVALSRNTSPDLIANESVSPNKPGLQTRPTSEQSRSVSSGRGSVEKHEDVDEEISMINAIPSTIPSSRIPDSGIQQDDDTISELSVHNHREYLARLGIDASKISRAVPSGGEATEAPRLDVGDVIYTQLEGSERNSVASEGGAIARSYGYKDMQPSNPNALSSIVNTEEVFSGSYNWDYLMNWGPQFLPMADLFTEIARLKDDSIKVKKKPTQIVPQVPGVNRHPRTVPPPLITDTPPRVIAMTRPVVNGSTQSSQTPHSRTPSNRSLASSAHSRVPSAHGHSSVARPPTYFSRTSAAAATTVGRGGPIPLKSPISYDNNFTSPIITPPFRQNISPLGTQSPTVISLTNSTGVYSPNQRPNPTGSSRQQTQLTMAHISSSNSDQEIHI